MDAQKAYPKAPGADIGLWFTATIGGARQGLLPVRLFGGRARSAPKTGLFPGLAAGSMALSAAPRRREGT